LVWFLEVLDFFLGRCYFGKIDLAQTVRLNAKTTEERRADAWVVLWSILLLESALGALDLAGVCFTYTHLSDNALPITGHETQCNSSLM
jgi:hypothetical protein